MTLGQSAYRQFEDLVYRLFEVYGLAGRRAVRFNDREADFLVNVRNSEVPVEVKLYGTVIVESGRVRQAMAMLDRSRRATGAPFGILVVSGRLSAESKRRLSGSHGTRILDLVDVLYWCAIDEELYDDVRSFFSALSSDDETFLTEFRRAATTAKGYQSRHTPTRELLELELTNAAADNGPEILSTQIDEHKGQNLCDALRDLTPGRADAIPFENTVTEIVKYLFGRNFSKWETQNTLDSGLRMDLCGKLFPVDRFWKSLERDFNCRYVVFEFKNYAKQVTQEQVYSTEKYLLRDALRTIAIVISTNGADDGAKEASRGALREGGKVIVHLDVDDLCVMLRDRDAGGGPERILEERLDSMLMRLSR